MSALGRPDEAQVAIFGAGRIGKIHAGNLAAQPGVKLKVVVDPDAAAAAALAAVELDQRLDHVGHLVGRE